MMRYSIGYYILVFILIYIGIVLIFYENIRNLSRSRVHKYKIVNDYVSKLMEKDKEYAMIHKLKNRRLFKYIIKIVDEKRKEKLDQELYSVLVHMKNLSLAGGSIISSDYLIEAIMKFTYTTKKHFNNLLIYWRIGQYEEAKKYFIMGIDTNLSKGLINILATLDDLDIKEFIEQINLLLENYRNEKQTKRIKKQENISNLIFIPIIITAFLILLNFVVITVWLDTINELMNM